MAITQETGAKALKHSDGMPHVFAKSQWNYTRIDLAGDTAVVISTGPTELGPIYVEAAISAHTTPILDGENTAFSIPASLAAGTVLNWTGGIRFENGLSIDSNNSATGTIVVLWRPI